MHLLDVNVLIALADPYHVAHERTQQWFHGVAREAWSTCPLTENGFIRIMGQTSYKDSPGPPSAMRDILREICSQPGHQFWPDSFSLRDQKAFPKLPASAQLTDFYLLALALHRKGKFATLDRRIDPSLLAGGKAAYVVIPE